MVPQCSSSNDSTIEPKKGKICASWEMENESSNTFGPGDDGGNTTSTMNMGSSFASLGESSWANAELEDLFEEVASPKNLTEENTRTTTTTTTTIMDNENMVCVPDLMTPPPRQRSTLSLSQFEREGLLKSSKSDRMSSPMSRSSAHNPLVSPRESRKGLKKSKSERFTGLENKKMSRPGSLRDLKKDAGKMSSSLRDIKRDIPSRRQSQGWGSDRDLKALKTRRVKDSFESSDWLTSCYVDPFEKAVDKEPRRRTRTIMVDPDSNDDEGNCRDGIKSIPNRESLSRSKASGPGARPSLLRTASMPSVQRPKEDPPGQSSNSNFVWNNERPTTPSGGRNSNSTKMRTLVRSSSSTEANEDSKDRRSRFGLSRAFQSFRQLPTGFISPTSSNKQSNLKSVLRGAVQVVEKQP